MEAHGHYGSNLEPEGFMRFMVHGFRGWVQGFRVRFKVQGFGVAETAICSLGRQGRFCGPLNP